jgi:hypothetical protein
MTAVCYLGRNGATGSYYRVRYEGEIYFVYAPNGINEKLSTDLESLSKGIGQKTVSVNTKLYSKQIADAAYAISSVNEGTVATIIAISDSGNWYYVRLDNGGEGYMLSAKFAT